MAVNSLVPGASTRTPVWVWILMIAMASIPLTVHFWIAAFPPNGLVPTGLHGGDSAVFIHCMRMFATNFFSPYANAGDLAGMHSPAHFSAPFFWMYGVIGALGRLFRIPEFLMLGLANGAGVFLYLLAVYVFLREAFPRIANRAFALFALAGGPGGLAYLVAVLAGLNEHPMFEAYFERFAQYQLVEGTSLAPMLIMTRLYYTVPLACLFTGFACYFKAIRAPSRARWAATCILLFAGTLLNLRFGPMAWAILVLRMASEEERPAVRRICEATRLAMPVVFAGALGSLLLRNNPAYVKSALVATRNNLWFSPFVCAILPYLPLVPGEAIRNTRAMSCWPRLLAGAGLGYLAGYATLYVLYNAYYGNVWRCLDFTSALWISDPALLGAAAGACVSLVVSQRSVESGGTPGGRWATLWLLAFLCVSLSAFGHGRFLRFGPQRFAVFLAVPFAILAAECIERIAIRRPRAASALFAIPIVCGVGCIAVAWTCFQGPLGFVPGRSPFAWTHCELMPRADAEVLEHIDGGVVLTPVTWGPAFGDIAAVHPGVSTVQGYGAMNLSSCGDTNAHQRAGDFFTENANDAARRKVIEEWRVDYVYCPGACPVPRAVADALRAAPWLEEIAASGDAVLFRVITDAMSG